MLNRAYGCLAGAAIGDAMGAPFCFLTREQIKETYGYIDDFPESGAEITDDTQETMIVAEVLIENGRFNDEAFGAAMRKWALEKNMLESELIGPSTEKYLRALIAGEDTREGAKTADTNGSAMRAAPIGIRYNGDFFLCREAAAASSFPSHGSAPAVAAACAVACACAAGVRGGFSVRQVISEAILAAEYGETVGFCIPAPKISKRIALAADIVDKNREKGMGAVLDELVGVLGAGMKSYESVPLSLGVFYAAEGRVREGILAAINAGDDADTNGSICGAICGAYSGAGALPESWIRRVENRSGVDLKKTASLLLKK